MKNARVILVVLLVSAGSVFAINITDNFDDGIIGNGPDTGAPPASWSGDIDTEPGWNADGDDAWGYPAGSAASDDPGTSMTLNFGESVTYAEVEFDLFQPNNTGAAYRMNMGFETDQGYFAMEASPQEWRYGGGASATSIASYDGLHNIIINGNVEPQNRLPRSGWQHFKYVFDLAEYDTIKVYADDEGDGTMELVAIMENWHPSSGNTAASSVIGFTWQVHPEDAKGPTWAVDNVSVVPEPATMALLAVGGLAAIRRRK